MPLTFDILFKNGNFWTGDPQNPSANYIACKDGRIVSISKEKTSSGESEAKKVIDLRGHFAMPGFIDSHVHLTMGGASLHEIDLRSAKDECEFAEKVGDYAKLHGTKWITGGNWDHESWKSPKYPRLRGILPDLRRDKRLPTKELIDKFTPSTPVFLNRYDTHMALVNSYVLRLAGINKDTPDPPGGVIVRDEQGEPTGILKDAAREMVLRLVPEPSLEDRIHTTKAALKHANKLGVTSVHDISFSQDLKTYEELRRRGELTARIYSILPIAEYKNLASDGIKVGSGNEWIKTGALKAFADGSLGSGTAWFFEPYEDDKTNFGIASDVMSSGELEKWAIDADRNRLQLAIHAIGDKAVSRILDLFEKIQEENPLWERRFRIEHAQHVRDEDFARFKKLNVIASVQPYHCIDDGRWALEKIGERRAKTTYAFKRMLDENVSVAFGTDWPVAPLDPLEGIYAAVSRATLDGKNPDGWVPEQKISVEQVLKAYTQSSAFASFEEYEKGTLEVGRLADMVVLSINPFVVKPAELKHVKVLLTVVGGKVVFADKEFAEHYEPTAV
ncbi:MAG: amidohydrolase [Bacteroidetes bacterium]|nr:amidohydrolase [Bacteroidota bacterium]MCL5738545.1 amidohydrolase [Bacteroidota bacterium]